MKSAPAFHNINAPKTPMQPDPRFKNIILAGFMGSGKTTVGRLLAGMLGWEFVDTDEMIEKRAGMKIAEIFDGRGEVAFRDLETEIARELPGLSGRVISTGGGFVLREENRRLAAEAGAFVLLVASPDEIWHRVGESADRPLLRAENPRERIERLLESRADAYASVPLRVETDGLAPQEVARRVLENLRT